MKLEEMKRIADARTKGEWEVIDETLIMSSESSGCDEDNLPYYNICSTPKEYGGHSCNWGSIPNTEFIAMAANNWDKLMGVVEAAKKLCAIDPPHPEYEMKALYEALEELEKE